jgi:hypothetical protein
MFKKNFHSIAMAAAAGAGLLLASASPSMACIYVTVNPSCTESGPETVHGPISMQNGALYGFVPGDSAMTAPSARHRVPRRRAN